MWGEGGPVHCIARSLAEWAVAAVQTERYAGLARRRAWMILMSEVRLSLLIDNFKIFDR